MSVRRSKDGARKRDPGGGGEVKTRQPAPPDSIPSCPGTPTDRSEKMLTGSKPVTPLTPGTPIHPSQNIIYSTRLPSSGAMTRTHAGRVLRRADTGVIIPPNFLQDNVVGPRSQSVTILPGVNAIRTGPTTVAPRVVELVDERLDESVNGAESVGGTTNGYPGGVDAEFNTPRKWITRIEGDDERILLNVGGVRHETHVSTLRAIPNSRLSRLAEMHVQSGGGPQEYFFDRHPSVFNAIIDFYRTGQATGKGELHVPLEVCGAVVKRELDFWQIDELEIKACCWRHYRSYIENQNILDSFNNSLNRENVHVDLDALKGWKRLQWQVWLILEYPRTSRPAMAYGVTSFLFVVTSIGGFCLETLPQLRPTMTNTSEGCDGEEERGKNSYTKLINSSDALNVLDIVCTVFFTLELILRFTFAPNKRRFVVSIMNIIDLLALVPLYVTVIFQKSDLQACYLNERFVIEIMFILRIIRMFRIFHLVKHYQALKVLVYSLKASMQELLMLFIFLLIGMLIFSTMIYYAERKDSRNAGDMFPTIPMGFWWSIITMTTVGYGDVYPTTHIGYIVGTACSVSGVLLVALTIPVISNNFTLFYRHVQSRSIIPRSKGGEADSEIDIPETLRPVRKVSLASNDGGPILNGHVSGMSHMCVPMARFSQANSMTNIVLPKSESDFNIVRSRSPKAHSDDGVNYSSEAFV